jgi:CheY-like chemotaxis protein
VTRHPATLAGLRILVAEDQAAIAMMIEDMLEGLGCEVVGPTPTVEAALVAIRENRLDGALLDLNLHGRDALPAAEELSRRNVPVVLVTGYAGRDSDAPALKTAPRLRKPFKMNELRRTMMAAFVGR